MSPYLTSTSIPPGGYHGVLHKPYGGIDVDEERILNKLDGLDSKTTNVLVSLARLEEQIKDVPDLKMRVMALEKWKWTAMGAIGASGGSLALSLYSALKGGA